MCKSQFFYEIIQNFAFFSYFDNLGEKIVRKCPIWPVIVGLRGLIGCFDTYLLFPINTPWGAQAVMAHRGVKTKFGQWQPRLCRVLGSVFPHHTLVAEAATLLGQTPNCLKGCHASCNRGICRIL